MRGIQPIQMDLPSPVMPVENGRSKLKRIKSTKLKDFDDPMEKYHKGNTKTTAPLYHIPLRLSLKKTAHKDVSLEKALPRKRFTRNRTPSNAPSIVRLEAEPALVTEVDSGKKVDKKKFAEPWNTGAYDDEDKEGDAVNKKEDPNKSPRLKVTDNGISKSLKVFIPKKALEKNPAISEKMERKHGTPRERPRNRLVSRGAGVSKRGEHLKGRSSPTRQALPEILHQISEQAVASAATSAAVSPETKKVPTRRGNKMNNESRPAEIPHVNGKVTKRSSERLRRKVLEVENIDEDINAVGISDENSNFKTNDELASGLLPNTVNVLNGSEVPEAERKRKRKEYPRVLYSSQKSTVRRFPVLSTLPGDFGVAAENGGECILTQRLNAMMNAGPAAKQENLDRMMTRIEAIESQVHRLNKNETVARSELSEPLRNSERTKSIARLKMATDIMYMAIREVVDNTDHNPVKMAEVIQNIWPDMDEVSKNEPGRVEKQGIRSAVRGILWDRHARNGSGSNGNVCGNHSNANITVSDSGPAVTGGSAPKSSREGTNK